MTDWKWMEEIIGATACPCCDKAISFDTTMKLIACIKEMRGALEFYAQQPVPDKESIFAKSAEEWGQPIATWEPLLDMGDVGRAALARCAEGNFG